ncbi:MAG: nucleotidyl transferase AbiEii/AbiGii toxin family protein [Planctomycetota bacterium]
MDRIARAPPEERAELFRRSASVLRPERAPAIIEKDFWVCWTLHRLFEALRFHPQLIFKGGTSLSKAYDAVQRFSEDVDLSFSRKDLGFAGGRDPEEPGISGKESRRRIQALVAACERTIRDRFLPLLREDFKSAIGAEGWNADLDAMDPQAVNFSYPRSELSDGLPEAIRPSIRLELGARSDDWPAEVREIQPYAAEAFPKAFSAAASCRVLVLDARRTFWEKATLLHAEFHRPAGKSPGEGLSRHYYDLYRLSQQDIGRQALERVDLLERVVAHKRLFFASSWAHFETAVSGSFHLVPPASRLASLRSDYARMRQMIFGNALAWEEILQGLRMLEARINDRETGRGNSAL